MERRRFFGFAAGGTVAMALKGGGNQLSQFMRLAFLRSPNYVAGSAGWTINQDGSAEFNNLTLRGTFFGLHFIINSAGAFFYSGVPATGNLIASITDAGGNDGLPGGGNAYLAGITNYGTGNQINMDGAALNFGSVSSALANAASLEVANITGQTQLRGQRSTGIDAVPVLSLLSAAFLGQAQALISPAGTASTTGAFLEVQGSEVVTGGVWCKAATPSGAPPTGAEGWNSLGTLAGYTIQAGRYRFTPQNEVEIDIEVTAGGANASSVSFANALPAAYQPLASRHLPLASTRAVTAADPWPRLFVQNNGTVSVIQVANSAASLGGIYRIPLD